jgi:hypothetical protein
VAVTADGVPFSNLNAATGDYDAVNGINLLDVGASFADVLLGTNRLRSDYDGNGTVNLLDVGACFALVTGGGSPFSCTTLCP